MIVLGALCSLTLPGCKFQSIAEEEPGFEPQLIIEAYLAQDSVLRVSVARNLSVYGQPDSLPVADDAVVQLVRTGQAAPDTHRLAFRPAFTPGNYYFFGEYRSADTLRMAAGSQWQLQVRWRGTVCTATTTIPDTLQNVVAAVQAGPDTTARLSVTWATPAPGQVQYYRLYVLNHDRTQVVYSTYGQDTTSNEITRRRTPYQFVKGRTYHVYLASISPEHYTWLRTWAQNRDGGYTRANLLGNVMAQGGTLVTGIFTGVGMVYRQVQIPE